jgi:hypothetical protein
MSNPYFNFGNATDNQGMDDGAGQYAGDAGQLLTFLDDRTDISVSFIAFLSSFSQAFTSNWNAEEVMGRMDSIATFKNTQRTISVAWEVPAANIGTAKKNLKRCNRLVSFLYPTYMRESATVMAKSPLIRLKFANLIQDSTGGGLLGYVTSFNWSPVIEMGYYEKGGKIYPKVLTLSAEFTVIHEGKTTGWYPDDEGMASNHTSKWPFNNE